MRNPKAPSGSGTLSSSVAGLGRASCILHGPRAGGASRNQPQLIKSTSWREDVAWCIRLQPNRPTCLSWAEGQALLFAGDAPRPISAGRAPSCRSVLGKVSSLPEAHPPRRLSTHPLCLFLPPQSFGRLAVCRLPSERRDGPCTHGTPWTRTAGARHVTKTWLPNEETASFIAPTEIFSLLHKNFHF